MNDNNLISIDDDSLEQVAGSFGFLSALLCKPVAIVTGLFSALLGGCAPAQQYCAPPPANNCRQRRSC